MENTAVLNVRISEQLKQKLSKLAKEKNETVSDYVRELLTKHVLQGGDYVSGILPVTVEVPQEVASIVAECALLKGQTVPEFVREYLTDYLTDDMGGERFGIILTERIKQLLKEKGPLTGDELLAELPERVRRDMNMDDFMNVWLHYYVQQTDDGKYELKKEQS